MADVILSSTRIVECLHKSAGCLPFTPEKSAEVVMACMQLHNFSSEHNILMDEEERNILRNRLGEATLESLIRLCLHTERLGEKEVRDSIIDMFNASDRQIALKANVEGLLKVPSSLWELNFSIGKAIQLAYRRSMVPPRFPLMIKKARRGTLGLSPP
ncbi:hypothetical protein DPMN_160104 [Dreissena polymorpha]|uniref:Uncharacterized protein n=1 Tax=Dreissena polymorpha TaxID=45954 RepID=A0A9D4EQK3_DREPO|nr:hypothetical protein DPMN_160104 [Dreissena polymorpha]